MSDCEANICHRERAADSTPPPPPSRGQQIITAASSSSSVDDGRLAFELLELLEHLEHLECGQQPHVQDRGAKKRTQLAGRSGSGYGLESPSPGGARSQGHNTSPRDGSVYRVTP